MTVSSKMACWSATKKGANGQATAAAAAGGGVGAQHALVRGHKVRGSKKGGDWGLRRGREQGQLRDSHRDRSQPSLCSRRRTSCCLSSLEHGERDHRKRADSQIVALRLHVSIQTLMHSLLVHKLHSVLLQRHLHAKLSQSMNVTRQ